jgi:hypothetical protein
MDAMPSKEELGLVHSLVGSRALVALAPHLSELRAFAETLVEDYKRRATDAAQLEKLIEAQAAFSRHPDQRAPRPRELRPRGGHWPKFRRTLSPTPYCIERWKRGGEPVIGLPYRTAAPGNKHPLVLHLCERDAASWREVGFHITALPLATSRA